MVSPKNFSSPRARCVSSCQPGCVRTGVEGGDRLDRSVPPSAGDPSGAPGRHGAYPSRAGAALAAPPSGCAHAGRRGRPQHRHRPPLSARSAQCHRRTRPRPGPVLDRARAADLPLLCLDGTLLRTDRVAARAERGHHLWYSGKHHAFGGSVQVLADSTGFSLWVSPVRPGSTHDLTAARELVLPTLCPHAVRGLPVLADKGYTGRRRGARPGQAPAGRTPARRQPDLQPPDHRPAGADRTGQRVAGPLAGAGPRHRLPAAHWSNCCCRARSDIARPRNQVRNLSGPRHDRRGVQIS